MKLNVQETLKVLLVDNWEAVIRNNQVRFSLTLKVANFLLSPVGLVTLPRIPAVVEILHDLRPFAGEPRVCG